MNWIGIVFFTALGGLLGILAQKFVQFIAVARARKKATEYIEEAEAEAERIRSEEEPLQERLETFETTQRESVEKLQESVEQREERLESLEERIESRQEIRKNNEQDVHEQEEQLAEHHDKYESLLEQYRSRLLEKSGENRDRVLNQLKRDLESESRLTAKRMINSRENAIENNQDRIARHIVGSVIPRCDITNPNDVSTAVLKFPDDDAFDAFTEFYEENEDDIVELIDSEVRIEPDNSMAVVETLEPVQKEIAHRTLNNIIQQKKFFFDLVEEGVERYTSQVKNEQQRAAHEAMKECGVSDVPDRLVELLGVLQFRTSYGQHQLIHSQEVAHLGSLMAHEIGADPELTRRAGLLHDIGKAIDRQRESGHAVIGAEVAEAEGEHPIVVNGIGSHHGDMEPNSVESLLVGAADAISGSRPGARRENVTNYSERIEALLELAESHRGVRKVNAMNAGRELRIRVDRNQIKDHDMEPLAQAIARQIEDELTYSGEIKINTIRETRINKTVYNND